MKTPLSAQVHAGLMVILRDNKYYYQSAISDSYNKLTDEGKEAMLEFITIMAPHMIVQENKELDERSKKIMMNVLKE